MTHEKLKSHQALYTDQAPKPVGPYSQAIQMEGLIFLSGQIGLDPVTNQLVSEDVTKQTQQVMQNLSAVLNAAGSELNHIIKTTIFLVDMADFTTVNRIYAGFFSNAHPPARSTIQVSALPLGAKVEIDAIAIPSNSIMSD